LVLIADWYMPELLVERADGVVRLTLNRPDKMSAITRSMWGGLAEVGWLLAGNTL
jgi:enoyl-CoA hydratase/carnithine racemase